MFADGPMKTDATMIPAGYMAKRVSRRPDWAKAAQVADIYSLSAAPRAYCTRSLDEHHLP
jgi:hypothetical protein